MKKRIKNIIIISIFVMLCVSLCSCQSMRKYYLQKENYISVTGTVASIKYDVDATTLYVSFSKLSPTLDDIGFEIVGENLNIVQARGIDKKLKIGEQITFITAPKYFGDGYIMPIVSITINGETLLEFEDGYENFMAYLTNQ